MIECDRRLPSNHMTARRTCRYRMRKRQHTFRFFQFRLLSPSDVSFSDTRLMHCYTNDPAHRALCGTVIRCNTNTVLPHGSASKPHTFLLLIRSSPHKQHSAQITALVLLKVSYHFSLDYPTTQAYRTDLHYSLVTYISSDTRTQHV